MEKIGKLQNEIKIMKEKVKKEELKFEKYQNVVDKIIIKDKNKNNNNSINNKEKNRSNSKSKGKLKIITSVELGRTRKIIPREKYYINASEKK